MSQKIPSDGGEKSFAVGRGLLAAAETLNFSMNEQRSENLYSASSRPSSGMSSSLGSGEVKDRNLQLNRHGGGHINSTMKLFASLGLSPADLDMLSQVPEDSISMETLPHLIMQLKNRKADAGRRMGGNPRDRSPLSAVHSYRAARDDWGDMRAGRMSGTGGQASNRGQQVDYDYNSMQEGPSRGYERTDYGESSGGAGSRDRQFSNLSRDRYGGLGMGASSVSDNVFMARRTGSPSQGKVQDFLGVMPQMFPHVCSLCDFDVHSTMEWTQHVNGLRHAENRRVLLQMYPDWDPHQAPNRVSGSLLRETTNRSDGILGPVPLVPGLQRGGMNSNWGAGMSNQVHPISVTPKIRSRVVVAKYERKPLTLNSLLVLAQPFGTVCQHLVLKNKAFLELQTHEEAVAMVSFYQRKPAVMHGKEIILYLSRELVTIEKGNRTEPDTRDVKGRASQVVFFSNLPRERENKSELLTLARRFGTVEKYLFLNEQAFVQLGTPEDAEMMVKYYTLHPLTIKGRNIRLNICTKYKTLTLNTSWNAPGRQDMMRRGSASESRASFKGQKSASDRFKGKEQKARKEEELKAQDYATHGEGSGDEVVGVMEGEEAEEADTEKGSDEQEALLEAGVAEGAEEPSECESTAPQGQEEESAAEAASEPVELPPATGHACDTASETGPEDAADRLPENGEPPSDEERQAESQHAQAASPCAEAEVMGHLPLPETADSLDMPDEELAGQQDIPMEQDFPENMDDFVTLDEVAEEEDSDRLDPQSKSGDLMSGSTNQRGGLRVVNVVGFKRGYNFLEEILTLAKPFGKVVRHLVLDVRPEAFLELSTEEGARAMVDFYSANVTPRVCGKAVKIYHSQTYATIQSGRVIYVGQIPFLKSSDASLLKIAEPFGKVRRYFLNQSRNECFIEMERGEDAERMANAYKENPPKFQGKRLTVYVSRKYKQLKHGHRPPPLEPEEEKPCKRERIEGEEDARGSTSLKAMKEEEPPSKRVCVREENAVLEDPGSVEPQKLQERQPQPEEESSSSEAPSDQKEVEVKTEDSNLNMPSDSLSIQKDSEEECKDEGEVAPSNGVSDKSSEKEEPPSTRPPTEQKPMATPVTLGLYQPNTPVGVEYVKMGYYCRVCFLFYSNEETAKKVHCSSLSHYQKLKKHLEKDKTPKAQ